MGEAWKRRRWALYAALAEAHARNAVLEPKLASRLALALIHTGRFDEAERLLLAQAEGLSDEPGYWIDLARARAGSGRLAEAARALETCLVRAPGHGPAMALLAPIQAALALESRAARLDWADSRRLVDLLDDQGALARAAEVVRLHLARRRQPAPEDLEDLLGGVVLAFSACPPESAYALLHDLHAVLPKGPGRRLLACTLELLAGVADEDAVRRADEACEAERSLRLCSALALLAAGRRETALSWLGRITDRFKEDEEARLILARSVGDEVLASVPVRYRVGGGRKVFCLVMFNNERELLKAKLAEESAWVDRFVIVEARYTFTGLPKPLHFEAWKSEFAAYADKIVHVKIERFPDWATTPWARDFYQRDMAVSGASGLWGVDDLVLITDADEIVDRKALEGFDGEFAAMRMETFRFFLNNHSTRGTQHTGVVFRAGRLQRFGSSYARFALRSSRSMEVLDPCGWHFTSVSDAAGVAAKMKSYAHQEYAHMDEAYFERILGKLRSGRRQKEWEHWTVDERFPAYIRENKARLAPLILPAPARPAPAA